MRILVIDTTSDTACVGLVQDGVVRAEELARVSSQHGETLLPRVAHVLEIAGLRRTEIDLIAVGLGPGSFTGVRIGLATAKGLAIGLGKPIVGVRTSRVLASAIEGARRVVAIDGKKGEVFASVWSFESEALVSLLDDHNGKPDAMASRVRNVLAHESATLVGTGATAYPAFTAALGAGITRAATMYDDVRAGALAKEARTAFDQRGPDDLGRLEPIYVRGADALLPTPRA